MDNWLNNGPDKERIQKLVELGISSDTATLTIDSESSLNWLSLRNPDPNQQAILFLGCNGLEGASVWVVGKKSGHWHVTDSLGLDCHYDDSTSVELAWIRDPASDEIFVHHDCGDRGTGYFDQHFQVLAIDRGKFVKELDVTDALLDDEPARQLTQRSTFAAIPIAGSKLRAIEETRSSTLNGQLRVERRSFYWSAKARQYLPSDFAVVSAPGR